MSTSSAHRLSRLQWLVLGLILALFFVDGLDTQLLAVAVPSMAREWALAPSAFALALAVGHAGGAIGALVGGMLGDRIGRKNTMALCVILFGVMSIAITQVQTLSWLVILRLLCGFGLGGTVPPAVALLSELFAAENRGTVIALAFLCAPFGIATVGLLAAAVIPEHGWRSLFWMAGIAPLCLSVLLFGFLPGKPSDEPDRARAATSRSAASLRWWQTVRTALTRNDSEQWSSGAIGLCAAFFFAYAAMSIVLTWLPSLLANHGFSLPRAALAVSVWSLSGMAGIPFVGWAGGRFGTRRVATLIAIGGGAAALLVAVSLVLRASLPFGNVVFYALLSVTGVLANGLVIMLYSLAAAEFPPSARSTGVGLASTSGRTGAIVCAYYGGRITDLTGVVGFFAVTAALFMLSMFSFNLSRWQAPH